MASFVLAGPANCPRFARAELLADTLSASLPSFKARKIIVPPSEWCGWLKETTDQWKWKHTISPLIWRTLGEGNPTASYIGGEEEFAALMKKTYGVSINPTAAEIQDRVADTVAQVTRQPTHAIAHGASVSVCVTAAASRLAYSMVSELVVSAFPTSSHVFLRLVDSPSLHSELEGFSMELKDCALPNVTITTYETLMGALIDCHALIVLDSPDPNISSMKAISDAINDQTAPTQIILATTTAPQDFAELVTLRPTIPRASITIPLLLHENVARHIVANRLSARVDSSCRIPSSNVQNIVVWGLPQTPLIDTQHAHVVDYGGLVGDDLKTPVTATLRDCNVQEDLIKRIAEYHKRPQLVSAAAHAIAVHVRTLQRGTAEGQCISMAVAVAESGYNLPPGVVAGLPVVVTGGAWSVVKGLVVTEAVLQELAVRVAQGQFPVLPPAPAAAPPPVVHGPSDAPATPVPRADPPNLAAAPTPPPVVLGPSDAPPEPPADSVVEIKSEGAVLAEAAGEAACEGEGAGAGSGAAATEVKTD